MTSITAPGVQVQLGGAGSDNQTALQFFLLLTVLSLVPAILMMVTSFVRITIVLSFVRNAIGAQQMPPNQVLVGLALFLSLFVCTLSVAGDGSISANLLGPLVINPRTRRGRQVVLAHSLYSTRQPVAQLTEDGA